MTALTRIVLGSIIAFSLAIQSLSAQTINHSLQATSLARAAPVTAAGASGHQERKQEPTPLHWVAFQGDAVLTRQLIVAGANVDKQVDSGSTPLHLAAYNGHTDVMELLIENGADLNMRTNEGITALDWARRNGHEEAITLLLDHGARPGKPFPEESAREFARRKALLEEERAVSGVSWPAHSSGPEPASAEVEDDYIDINIETDVNLDDLESVARVNRLLANYHTVNTVQNTSPAAATGGFRIQLASFRNERRALLAREQFRGRHPDILAGQELVLETFNSGTAQYHRVRSGRLPKSTALNLCEQLSQRDQDCILVR